MCKRLDHPPYGDNNMELWQGNFKMTPATVDIPLNKVWYNYCKPEHFCQYIQTDRKEVEVYSIHKGYYKKWKLFYTGFLYYSAN